MLRFRRITITSRAAHQAQARFSTSVYVNGMSLLTRPFLFGQPEENDCEVMGKTELKLRSSTYYIRVLVLLLTTL